MGFLHHGLTVCLEHSLASSTQSTYRCGFNSYQQFCFSFGLRSLPFTELNLCLFSVALAQRSISYQSIKVYLYGVQYHSLFHGQSIQISSMSYLRYVLRGIRRIQGNTLRRPLRNPITVSHLLSMLGFLSSSSFSAHDKAMWHSVIVTAFFGLLRVSEFTCPGNTFDASSHLAREDISFNRNNSILYIKIKASKTDPFRAGVIIRLAAIRGHKLCPVAAMRSYLDFRSLHSGPLFILSNGQYLTRRFVTAFLDLTLPGVPNINTHSFRIGGASAALSAGASDALIRIMGRWSSDCYNRYIRISDRSVLDFHNSLASTRTTDTWRPDSL